jgi:hypothetical protein
MCGRVLIQLSKSFDEIINIGCILLEKNSSEVDYKFISLVKNNMVNVEGKDLILKTLKTRLKENYVVEFSFITPPISPMESFMYFLNCYDKLSGDTSVVKLNTETLECDEIYQSRFEIVHIGMQETKIEEKINTSADA